MGLLGQKKQLSVRGASASSSGTETSNLRPYQIEKLAPCMNRCPNQTNIRGIITTIAQAEKKEISYEQAFLKSWEIISDKNPFPAVCGRVCPHPCEEECNRKGKDSPVAINNIERFVGDWALENKFQLGKLSDEKNPEKIAVIGAGPAGLSCAYQLSRRGYDVTVFEAFSKPGGMLRYGIPDYRLPQDILDKEIERIKALGVDIKCGISVGVDIEYSYLQSEYDAIFVGIGAHKGKTLGLEGEDAPNVYTGTDFLNKVNSGKSVEIGDKVVVIGGGDTAIDAARVAKRHGASDVRIVYRRTRTEMPAIEEEITGAEEEGIIIEYLSAPIEIMKKGELVSAIKCLKMELGEPDSSGRRRPVPIPGSEYLTEISCLIPAISQEPDFEHLKNLKNGKDWIKIAQDGSTNLEKTYSGGDDIELGLVTIAIAQGRIAAETIHSKFRGLIPKEVLNGSVILYDKMALAFYEEKKRNVNVVLPPDERLLNPDAEVSYTLTRDEVIDEAKRCMSCGFCFDCGTCWSLCQDQAIKKPQTHGEPYIFKLELCQGCKKCAEQCPCGYLEMK
ncbi:MAG: FAD-dependent pyridine nucleotide-disulfide oxidoreductase [Ignavibacteria bacterium]|nr:FAD-dependent pyridine nucleotide-disulfide oxidoreductase [Ignavibacteria bacterium]